ncbi:MAG: nuclear transport factor 2 family protein [Nitrososphaera sp.]|uniref:nuclear transport factor 2 family protein n=1 Tax=Nitrososphaera sp. TaxID=1971748 RepID=UPI003D6F8EDF
MKYHALHKVIGQGNFVLALAEGEFSGKRVAFYDLFRIENRKIVEHWDVIQDIPPKENWKNQNGKF